MRRPIPFSVCSYSQSPRSVWSVQQYLSFHVCSFSFPIVCTIPWREKHLHVEPLIHTCMVIHRTTERMHVCLFCRAAEGRREDCEGSDALEGEDAVHRNGLVSRILSRLVENGL